MTNEVTNQTSQGIASIEEAYHHLLSTRPGVVASEAGGELAWLRAARQRDFTRWSKDGIPTRRQERWLYTNLSTLNESHIVLPTPWESDELILHEAYPRLPGEKSAEVVFLNGKFVPEWSKLVNENGLSVLVLSEILSECVNEGWTAERREKFAAFQSHIDTSDADRETIFAAMNTSLIQDAVLIHLDAKVRVQHPIVVTFLSDSEVSPESKELPMTSPRVFASLGRGAQASIIEVYTGSSAARYFANTVSDLRVADAARLSYCQLQMQGSEGLHIGTTRIRQGRDSWTEAFQFSLGAKLSRQDFHVSLEGEGAEATVDGLYVVRGRQHVDNHTDIEHVVGNTTSEQIYKGILYDSSRAVFNGRVHIHRDAQHANASQLNKNLMLSPKAEVDTKPELDIFADDVKAAHGATIAQLDPEHIFYLQARAIPRPEAIKMLAHGFAQDVVFRIKNDDIRECLRGIVEGFLATLPSEGEKRS